MVAVRDRLDRDDGAVPLRHLDVDDAGAAPRLPAVLGHVRPLAVPVLRHREERVRLGDEVHLDDDVAVPELDPLHARRVAPHRPDVRLQELDPHAAPRPEKDEAGPVGDLGGEELVPLLEVDRDDPGRARVAVGREDRLLHEPLLRREEDEPVVGEAPGRGDRRDALPFRELDQVHERLAAGRGPERREVVGLHPVDLPLAREDEEIVVRRRDEEVLDHVLFLRRRARPPLPAAALRPVDRERRPLRVAAVRHGQDDLLLGDQVLDADLRRLGRDLRPARVAEPLLERRELALQDRGDALRAGEDLLQVRDRREDLLVLGHDLVPLEAREALEAHFENGLRLDRVELQEAVLEAGRPGQVELRNAQERSRAPASRTRPPSSGAPAPRRGPSSRG